MLLRYFIVILSLALGCTSPKSEVEPGIQPDFQGASFAKIAFFPVFSVPDPTKKAQIDLGEVSANSLYEMAEKESLKAFVGQTLVQGISPQAVVKLSEEKERKQLVDFIETSATNMKNFTINTTCSTAKSFVSFYTNCVSPQSKWREQLQLTSIKLQNADAILFLVYTDVRKIAKPQNSVITADIVAMLVDTNNGKLIWNRAQTESLKADTSGLAFPEWKPLLTRLLSDAFWQGFPGRTLVSN